MATEQLRVAGLRLVIEGASAFQDEVDKTNHAMALNREALNRVDAEYGKYNDTAEKTAAKQKILTEQMELQKQKLETMKNAYAALSAKEGASEKQKEKLSLAITKQETANISLNRILTEGAAKLERQQGAEQRIALEKEAYAAAMDEVSGKLNGANEALARNGLELKKLDALYGSASKNPEKLASSQGLLTEQLALQKQKVEALKEARAEYAASENMNMFNLKDMDAQIGQEEIAQAGLERQLRETTQEITRQAEEVKKTTEREKEAEQAAIAHAEEVAHQQAIEQQAALEKEAYGSAIARVSDKLNEANEALSKNGQELKKLDAFYGSASKNPEKLASSQALLSEQLAMQKQKLDALKEARAAYAASENMSSVRLAEMDAQIGQEELAQAGLERQLRETTQEITRQAEEAQKTAAKKKEAEQAAIAHADAMAKEEARLKSLSGQLKTAGAAMTEWGDKTAKAGKKVSQAGGKMMRNVTTPIVAGLTLAAKEVIEYEDAFASVRKTVDATEAEYKKLSNSIIGLSGSGLVTQGKEEIAEVVAMGGQLAIQKENLLGFSQAMLQMADATNLGSSDAAENLAKFANITGMSQTKFENLGSAVVALGNNTAAQEDAIVSMGMRIAAAGRQAKMSEASIMGISAAMASVGLESEAGGTAISKVLLNMDMASAKGEKAMASYAKVAGMSGKEFKALWDRDSAAAFTGFIEGLGRIDKEGGNVALTLEKMGYTEVRVRDALMRSAMAGDILGNAISLANKSYIENTALATEAAAKNSTFAARLKVLGNRAQNTAMGFGKQMMPYLEGAMDKVSGLVDGFGNLNEAEQQNILTTAAVAAGIPLAVKALGVLTQGVGYVTKGFGLMSTMLASPAGGVVLAVAGITALTVALASLESPYEKLQKKLKDIEFDVDEESVGKITAGINTGIEAANKLYSIQVAVDADTDAMIEQLNIAFEDGKLNKKEYTAASKWVNEVVAADIKLAKENMAIEVSSFREALGAAVDETGSPIFSQEQIDKQAALISERTSGLIDELEGYKTDYNALLKTIYKDGDTPTQAEIDKLNLLLEQIGTVRVKLQAEQDEAIKLQQIYMEMAERGQGGEGVFEGATAGVISEVQRNKQAVEEAKDAMLITTGEAIRALKAKGQTDTEDYVGLVETQSNALLKYEADLEAVYTDARNKLDAFLAAQAGGDGEALLTQFGEDYDIKKQVDIVLEKAAQGMNISLDDYRTVFTDEVIKRFMGGTAFEDASVDLLNEAGMLNSGFFYDLSTKLSEDMLALAQSSEVNPIMTYFKALMETPEAAELVDPTLASGLMADIMKLLDVTGEGEAFGLDLTEGIGTAIEKGKEGVVNTVKDLADEANDELKKLDGAPAAQNMVDTFRARAKELEPILVLTGQSNAKAYLKGFNKLGLGIASPSREARKSAAWFTEGFVDEIKRSYDMAAKATMGLGVHSIEGLDEGLKSIGALQHSIVPAGVTIAMPLGGNEEEWYRELYGEGDYGDTINNQSQSEDYSVTFNVDKFEVRDEKDARSLGVEIANINRRTRKGYGH